MNQNEFIQYVSNCTEVFYDEPEPEAALIFARALLARAEAAEAEAARLKEAGRMVQEEVTAWRDSYEALNEQRLALAARVADLEAQLAAQGWRPVTEDWPPYGVQHLGRAFLNSPTLLVTRYFIEEEGGEVWQDNDGMLFYGGEIRYCAAIPPLPPAPQETP